MTTESACRCHGEDSHGYFEDFASAREEHYRRDGRDDDGMRCNVPDVRNRRRA